MFASFAWIGQANAQDWDAPALKSTDPVSGSAYYIYNIGSDGFLNQGGAWSTQAAVSPSPRRNASTSLVSWTVTNVSGSEWTLKLTIDGSQSQPGVDDDFVASLDDANGTIFTDQGSGWGGLNWTVAEVDATNNIYTLQAPGTYTNFNASAYMGTESATESGNRGIANVVRWNRTSGDDYVKWQFITTADYDLYLAKIELDRYMRYAKSLGGIDLTDYITDYNSDVLATIQSASTDLLAELAPVDATSSIANNSFETNGFENWTNSGMATQTNDPNWTGITKDGTVYGEKWTSSNGNLAAASITQSLSGLTNGLYELKVSAFALQQGGSNPLHTNCFAFAGAKSAEVHAGKEYIVDMIAVTDGTLNIGYKLEGAIAANYTGFDNFKLTYYGAPSVSVDATLSDLQVDGTTVDGFDAASYTYNVFVPETTTSVSISATENDGNASSTGTGTLNLTDKFGTTDVVVTAEDGSTQITYTVNVWADDFSQLYPSKTNLVPDPRFTSLDNFGGWEWTGGARALNSDPSNSYNGKTSGAIASGVDGTASLDVVLSGKLEAGKTYRAHAKVYATSGVFNFGAFNADISPNEIQTTKNGEWEEMNFVFTVGSGVNTSNSGLYFNNYNRDGRDGFIDNWECYEVNNDQSMTLAASTSGTDWTVNSTSATTFEVLVDPGTTTVDLTATANGANATKSGDGTVNVTDSPITITVTAESGEATDYTVTISSQSGDASLKSLSVVGVVEPAFDPTVTTYTVYLPMNTTTVDPTVEANNANIQGITGDGEVDLSQSQSSSIEVTAENGSTETYTLNYFVVTEKHNYTFDDGNAEDNIGGLNGTVHGNVIFKNGRAIVPPAANGAGQDYGYISLDGQTLDLASYNGLSLEAFIQAGDATNDWYTMLYYFGNNGADYLFSQMTQAGDNVSNVKTTTPGGEKAALSTRIDDGNLHHVMAVLTNTTLSFYVDGTLAQSVTGSGLISAIGTQFANLFRGPDRWTDDNWIGSFFEFSIYEGAVDAAYVADRASDFKSTVVYEDGAWSATPTANDIALIKDDLTIGSTDVVTVGDVIVGADANLTVESGGSLIIMGGASGDATIKRNTTGNGGYSIVGAPVSGADLSDLSADYLYTWDGSSWSVPSGTMASGTGYFVGYDNATPEVSLSGALVYGDQSVAVSTAGDAFNLVANPYAASISIASFLNANSNISDAVYFWNDGGANNGSDRAGDYVTVNEIGSVGSVDLGDGVAGQNTTAANTDIASSQGFYVMATADGNVDFTPDMQTGGSNADDNFYRKVTQTSLKLALSGAHYNEVLFGFRADGTEGVDPALDALKKIGNENLAFYSIIEDQKYAIQGLPELGERRMISLGYDVKEAGMYELSIKSFEGLSQAYEVLAHYNGKTYNLSNNAALLNLSKGSGVIQLELQQATILGATALSSFTVYGAEGALNISIDKSVSQANIQIMDMSGKTIELFEGQSINNGKWSKQLRLQSGRVYIVKIQSRDGVLSQKFIY